MKNRILLLCAAVLLSFLVVYGQQGDTQATEKDSFFRRLFGRNRTEAINAVQSADRTQTVKFLNEPFVPASAFITDFKTAIPADAGIAELSLITPSLCWLTEGRAMNLVNPSQHIYSHTHYKYSELSQMNSVCADNGVRLVPVFDLTAACPHFREVTGHDMLSVEGMRFVFVLLDEFIENTNFNVVKIVAPESSYRGRLEEFFIYYPEISQITYTAE